jgi:tartrate-resistant acid phosphatase type 5
VTTRSDTLTRRRLLGGALALAALPRVAAAAKPAALDAMVIGDWGRRGHSMHRAVGVQMGRTAASVGSAYVISVGDNFYENGVTGVDDPQWQESFEAIYDAPSLQTPWHVILGNHDYIGDIDAQIDYSARSSRWRIPARYYLRTDRLADGTLIDFFNIDTNPFVIAYRGTKVQVDGQDTAAQLRWLDRALGQSTAAWKIVVGHHPIYTVARQHRDTPELIEQVLPLLRAHGVPVYINGHDHNLQDRAVEGIRFITCGAGSKTSRVKVAEQGEFSSDQHGFMPMSLSRDALLFSFVSETGEQLYQSSISRMT